MATPSDERQRRALWNRFTEADYDPEVLDTVLNNEGRIRGLSAQHLAPSMAAVMATRQDWEHLWMYAGPEPVSLGTYNYELVWYEVDWCDQSDAWVPDGGTNDLFWHYFGMRPTAPPTVTREQQVAGETDHIDCTARMVTELNREEVPPLVSALTEHVADEPVEPRVWLEPEDFGDGYMVTFDLAAWQGDEALQTGDARWVSVDNLDE